MVRRVVLRFGWCQRAYAVMVDAGLVTSRVWWSCGELLGHSNLPVALMSPEAGVVAAGGEPTGLVVSSTGGLPGVEGLV